MAVDKRSRLEKRIEKNIEMLLKKQVGAEKMASYLSTLYRKRRTNLLIFCGSLFEKTEMVNDEKADEIYFDEEVVCGFCAQSKTMFLQKTDVSFIGRLIKNLEGKGYQGILENWRKKSRRCENAVRKLKTI